MRNTTPNSPSAAAEGNKSATRSALAVAVVSAAVLAACGGDSDNPAPNPDPTPEPTPEVLPSVTVDVGSVGKSGKEIAIDRLDPRVTSLIANALSGEVTCTLAKNADGTARLVISPAQDGIEKATGCAVDGSSDNGLVKQNAKYEVFADTLAPRLVKNTISYNGGEIGTSSGFLDITKELDPKDGSPITIDIPAGQLPYGYKFVYDKSNGKATLSWDYTADASGQMSGSVKDEAGNDAPFSVRVDRAQPPPPEQPTNPCGAGEHQITLPNGNTVCVAD
jgi:hypothetical protein